MKKLRNRNSVASRKEKSDVSSETVPSMFPHNTHDRCAVRVTKCQEELETMQLDGALGDTLFGQEVLNLDPLVTLELDDLAGLLIFDEGTVASEFLSDRTRSVSGKT